MRWRGTRYDVIGATPAALARHRGSSYLEHGRSAADGAVEAAGWDVCMAHPGSTENATMPAYRRFGGVRSVVVVAIAVVCASLLAGASLLWLHYGTAVFFEMITSGIAACV